MSASYTCFTGLMLLILTMKIEIVLYRSPGSPSYPLLHYSMYVQYCVNPSPHRRSHLLKQEVSMYRTIFHSAKKHWVKKRGNIHCQSADLFQEQEAIGLSMVFFLMNDDCAVRRAMLLQYTYSTYKTCAL